MAGERDIPMAEVETQPLLGADEDASQQPQLGAAEETPLPPPPPRGAGFRGCCKAMELLEFRDRYVVRSTDPDAPAHAFSVGRSDGIIEVLPGDSDLGSPTRVTAICGVMGTIRLLAGIYILVITSRKAVGSHFGVPVFLVTSMKVISCNETLRNSTVQEKRDEAYFMTLLKTVEAIPGLYYSYDVDLTLNLQTTSKLPERRSDRPLWKQSDPRFVWNQSLLEELIEYELHPFIIPVIQGSILRFVAFFCILLPYFVCKSMLDVKYHVFVFLERIVGFQTKEVKFRTSSVKITLISRRCTRRLGTRMWRRGANLEGDTANFIETEQVIEFEGYKSSFLQIRGSIPLLWEQIVDLSYKPRLNIIDHDETSKVVERHFRDLMQRYGDVISVDLTDKHGDEGKLSLAFAGEMEKLSIAGYVSFDFHRLCGNGNFSGLQLLYDQISDDFEKQGYFIVNSNREILREQKGVFRVNCIDCLDRTNVTQSFLARKSLNVQLQKMEIFSSDDCISAFSEVEDNFRTLWADHGDEISLEYAGTYALKGDLVRYGRQTISGLLKDGMSAMSRYYLNNFQDGVRQDALDLISGRYHINNRGPSPFPSNGFESFSYLPVASALIVGGLTMTTLTLNQVGRNTQHFVSSVLWAGLSAGVLAVVKANGRQFCSRPRLCNLL